MGNVVLLTQVGGYDAYVFDLVALFTGFNGWYISRNLQTWGRMTKKMTMTDEQVRIMLSEKARQSDHLYQDYYFYGVPITTLDVVQLRYCIMQYMNREEALMRSISKLKQESK